MHDISYLIISSPEDVATRYRAISGMNLHERFTNVIDWYKQNGYKIISKIYRGSDHRSLRTRAYAYHEEYLKDIKLFYQEGIIGDGFKKGKASADKIRAYFDDYVR